MLKKMVFLSFLSSLFAFAELLNQSYADNALVLPRGVAVVFMEGRYYFPVDKRFNNEGKEEDLAAHFNGKNLDSTIFPGLKLVEQFFGMPPGSASIGKSIVSFRYKFEDVISVLQYGLTDQLTIGVMIPYFWQKNEVTARLDSTNATVGKNPSLNSLTPLSVPGTVRLTTKDVQDLIGRGLDINGDGKIDVPGFHFKLLKTWSGQKAGDIEIGGRYQYLKTENWRLAFTGGVRLPTGQVDDPDDLADIGFGSGVYAFLFRFNHDYIGIKNLLLNATLRYDLVLPNHERLRVPDNVDQPITVNEENVARKIGDKVELETSGMYEFSKGFYFSLLYKYGYKSKDHVSGDRGFHYESLESKTRATEHIGIASLRYSTIPLFQAKTFPLPMIVDISYRNRFAGTNVLKSQYISLNLGCYF